MLKSNLVIVDYISTPYLESLLMNIPTVFFWKRNAYYLNKNYSNFFDSLIKVGICQTDPIEAAHFVDSIKDDPELWWKTKDIQDARETFLTKNFGRTDRLIKLLVNMVDESYSA